MYQKLLKKKIYRPTTLLFFCGRVHSNVHGLYDNIKTVMSILANEIGYGSEVPGKNLKHPKTIL